MQAIISELELAMNLEHAGWIKSHIEDAINYILFSVEVKRSIAVKKPTIYICIFDVVEYKEQAWFNDFTRRYSVVRNHF